MMMRWKMKALLFLLLAVLISIGVAACVLFVPSLRKRLEKRDTPEKPGTVSRKSHAQQLLNSNVCASEECVLAAARILKYMDMKVDPCDDFYNYSCGKFLLSHSIPETWDSYGTEDIYNEELDVTVKSVLEGARKVNQSASLSKAKAVYKTCVDVHHIEEFGIRDLKDVFTYNGAGVVGDWPFLNPDWKDCRLDIEWRMAQLNLMGLDSLFRLETKFGGEDHRLFAVLSVAEPLVDGICDDDPDNITIVLERAAEHREVLESVLELLGVTLTNVTEQDIDDLFEFDFLFCNATKESRMKGPTEDVESLNMTLVELAELAPEINWRRWRGLIFSELRVENPETIYIDGLESAILKINNLLRMTTSKVQANYLTWRFVLQHLGFLGKEFRQVLESHSRLIVPKLGNLQMSSDRWIPRWRQCVIYVKNLMPMSLLHEYGSYIEMRARENEMDSITSLVTDEFKMIMKDAKDLRNTDRMRSAHKIGLIQFLLTYPHKDRKFFDTFYMDMGIVSDSFLKNGLKLRLIRMRKLLEGVTRSKTIHDMEYTIQTIYSAFGAGTYSFFRGNQIVISLGALQSCPVNNKVLPKFMTLSTFGSTIGHELAHGFDLLALDGTTGQNWTWWHSSIASFAKAKAECYLKFYQSGLPMTVDDALKSTSLNEDLCDNQGIILAHRAYLRYLSSQSREDEMLPGLPLTSRELFFVSYAQQFCEVRRSESSPSLTSPGRRRVNQVLQNYAPFSETFNCPREKPMNPLKCDSIWM